MPVVKGGVWTNIEDEVLKVSVSKYGLNQWARVSSLLARKTPKQCKARWVEWLDPSIRKIEWSKEEDEKLLHLAKLMPTQWRTIAPMVGRTATQCLERYQKLLDEAEAKEKDELSLGGPTGGETAAPSADDVRRLRPGELDPDPESKPARPDTIDLDEDEKEMLSEARARLANTQGKKTKRKARERQLEESRRLALLQKRRELKNAGINIKITNRKKGQMDYNADIPFEKRATPGFYDTQEEKERNEKQREAFDPRKQQLANKRKGGQEDFGQRKKQKDDKKGPSAAFAAAAKAGQMQKIREAEQSSKRRSLNLPAPQVGEAELEDIVKMGMVGEQAHRAAGEGDSEATKGFIGDYSGIVGSTTLRTPRAPPQEDHITNEIRNIRALNETQSSLLGGENTPLPESSGSTGFDSIAPRKHVMATPNPMATPMRQRVRNGLAAPPTTSLGGLGETPSRTPRDNFAINQEALGAVYLVSSTPREVKLREQALRSRLKSRLAALPKPRELDFELELPEDQQVHDGETEISEEDAAERDRRSQALRKAAEEAELKRRTQVIQRGLPRPAQIDIDNSLKATSGVADPVEAMIMKETALLIANDAVRFSQPGTKVQGSTKPLETIDDESLDRARMEIAIEMPSGNKDHRQQGFEESWKNFHEARLGLSGLTGHDHINDDDVAKPLIVDAFDKIQSAIFKEAERGNVMEKHLALHYGGYQQRAKTLRQKIIEAYAALEEEKNKLNSLRTLQVAEEAALPRRLKSIEEEVRYAKKRENGAQDLYRQKMQELDALRNGNGVVDGLH
ncbi:Pre-mRNA-splicing factor cef1 [Puttea exsequens]|nr:Pre-mRNA-splicing factor cef1 [Puttea exsequens]